MGRHRQHDEKDTLAVVPWFRRDWLSSAARAYVVRTGDVLAGWCYRELLDAHWGEEDCALRDDDESLASLAGVSLRRWRTVRDRVIAWMDRTPEGKFRSRRAYFEWRKARRARNDSRAKATAAAKARWQKEKAARQALINEDARSNAPSIGKNMLGECPPSPSPSPSPTPTPTPTPTPVLTTDSPNGAAVRAGGEGSNGGPPAPPASGARWVLDHDASNPLEASVASKVAHLASLTAERDGDADAFEILAAVSTTPAGNSLDHIRGAPAGWLGETVRACDRFESDNFSGDETPPRRA